MFCYYVEFFVSLKEAIRTRNVPKVLAAFEKFKVRECMKITCERNLKLLRQLGDGL